MCRTVARWEWSSRLLARRTEGEKNAALAHTRTRTLLCPRVQTIVQRSPYCCPDSCMSASIAVYEYLYIEAPKHDVC
jgi:hypothetical protein